MIKKLWAKLKRELVLTRGDGVRYLHRRGIGNRWFGIYVHRFDGPDPGIDLHDHPWWFGSLILKGGYTEIVADIRTPEQTMSRKWKRWSWHTIDLTQCHTIEFLHEKPTWTLIIRGPVKRRWGFYEVDWSSPTWQHRWVHHSESANERRDLVATKIGGGE